MMGMKSSGSEAPDSERSGDSETGTPKARSAWSRGDREPLIRSSGLSNGSGMITSVVRNTLAVKTATKKLLADKKARLKIPASSSSSSSFHLPKAKNFTPDGKRIYKIGSLVMLSPPAEERLPPESIADEAPPLSCFMRYLEGLGGVSCMQIKPNGTSLVTAGSEKATQSSLSPESGWLQVWERQPQTCAWQLARTLKGRAEEILGSFMPAVAAYNGDSADADSDVNKCCAASLAESWEELIGDSLPPVSCICMHPTQKISATGHGSPAGSAKGGGCHVIIWCMATAGPKALLKGHTNEVTAVQFHPDEFVLISSSRDATIRLWDCATETQFYAVPAHNGTAIICMKILSLGRFGMQMLRQSSPESSHWGKIASQGRQMLRTLSAGAREQPSSVAGQSFLPRQGQSKVRGTGAEAPMDPRNKCNVRGAGDEEEEDSTVVVSGGYDYAVALTHVATGELIHEFLGHEAAITGIAHLDRGCPALDRLASSANDNTVRIWHVVSAACVRVIRTDYTVMCLQFHKQEGLLATGNTVGQIHLWDHGTGSCMAKFQSKFFAWMKDIAFLPNSATMVSLNINGVISFLEWKSNWKSILPLKAVMKPGERPSSMHHNMIVNGSGTLAAISDHEFVVKLWDLTEKRVLRTLGKPIASRNFLLRYFTSGLCFHPHQPLLAVAGGNEDVRVYACDSGDEVACLQHHTGRVCCLSFSPSGDLLASGSYDKMVILWDTCSWQMIKTLDYHHEWVTALSFSPDGRWLASGSWDDRLVLYDTKAGTHQSLECYSNVWTAVWAPLKSDTASKTIAVGTGSGMILYFVLEGSGSGSSWKDGGTLRAHENVVASLAFHPEGGSLLSSSLDNTVRLWSVEPDSRTGKTFKIYNPQNGNLSQQCPLEPRGLYLQFRCAVLAVTWSAQPPSCLHQGNSGTMVGICTKNSGQYILDGTDIGQPAASYTRAKFVYDQGGGDGLRELIRHRPLTLTAMGSNSTMILHDLVKDVDLLGDAMEVALQNGINPLLGHGPQPLVAEAYSIPSEAAVGCIIDAMLSGEADAVGSLEDDIGTSTILMLAYGFPDQAARLLSTHGLCLANEIVYDDKWREFNPRVRLKSGSAITKSSHTQYPVKIWGPSKIKKHSGEKEIDVVAACASFQYAAGIPPREFEFGKGFLPSTSDEDIPQPGAKRGDGLERTLLHIAYNNDAMEIMDTPVGRAILNYKWVTYGKRAYYRSMIAPMLMILFTSLQSCIWYLVISCGEGEVSQWDKVGRAASACCMITALYMFWQECLEMYNEGISLYFSSGWNTLDICVVGVCMISSGYALTFGAGAQPWTQFACMICWLEVFNMLRADARFGLIVRMYLNIANDIKYLIYLQVFLCVGASFSFVGVFDVNQGLPVEERHDEPAGADIFEELWNTILNVYGMLLGNVPLDAFAAMDYRFVYQLMFLLFVYIQTILFMNLIIAMMGESFEKVLQAAQRELTTDRAELLIRVELTMGVQQMRSMGYLPRYLHVLLPKTELKTEYTGASHGAEWAGVAGTVNNELSRKILEYKEETEEAVRNVTGKKIEQLTQQIAGVKKDLKDHMNSLEKRVLATGKAQHDSGGDAGGTTRDAEQGVEPGLQPQLPGDGNEALLRRIVREELEKLITTPQQ